MQCSQPTSTVNLPRQALVIAHEPNGEAGQIETRLRQRGVAVETHFVTTDLAEPNRARPFPSLAGYDLLVPMGSVRSLTNRSVIDSWIGTEIELIAGAHRRGIAILGICFGGQLLAEALGGRVEAAPRPEVGWYEIAPPEGSTNPVGPGPWKEWHHDRFHPPPGAEVLAVTDDAVQLFRIGRSVGTQFHPEVDVAHIEAWLSSAPDEYLTSLGTSRTEVLAAATDHEAANIAQCHRLVDWFLDEVYPLPYP